MFSIHRAASGRPVVILPSNGMCAELYEPLAERLAAAGRPTTAFTLPGFDGTAALADRRLTALVDHVRPFVAEALGDGGTLVGHSLGGMLAFLLAPSVPARSLVLLEPAIVPVGPLMRLFARSYRRGAVDVAPGFRNRGPFFWRLHDPSAFPAAAWEVVRRVEATTDPAVVRGLLATAHEAHPLPYAAVRCPVTVVRGTSSGPVMWMAQRLLARRLAGARCVDIAGAGHWMVHEVDDALADAVLGG